MAATRILMVCMGNICRSPTAEGVLRDKLARAGLAREVLVDSAGTHAQHHNGEAPDPRAIKAAAARGYDLRRLRARRVVEDDYARFDWLFAMDEDNLETLRARTPQGATARVELLMAHGRRFPGVAEIPDPYYGAAAGFERVLDLIEDGCDGLVSLLLQRNINGTS
ncbi:MAG: low molecular weight phosphotyrosine protein phosphatase [Burkholderiales bacterium]|nr:low molecular weight phosphotyrosine protein phosphatase [Burkholderiales bacterium]MDE2396495.1 low molecular weight phosphotyrosine protein phosphatase [Burkholderiales bacterium]MDE2455189.1 low molecular weight phosphotyrosine protein phosphatase [Burkholderiales bacterium]